MKKFWLVIGWVVIIGFTALILYSFAFAFTELVRPENAIELGLIVLVVLIIFAVMLNRTFDNWR